MNLSAELLERLTPWRSAPAWWVAFSGGLDSTVLLHLLVTLRDQQVFPALRAIHVHHGLQAAAENWPAHCRSVCEQWGVELVVRHVCVPAVASVEQAARQARYEAFAQVIEPGHVLLTGQHQDDQAETVLLRLFRGAGVKGLGAMRQARPLGAGQVLRPLLHVPRPVLEAYAARHGLSWVEDPSNADSAFSRNWVRRHLLVLARQHWPNAAHALTRTASHMQEAQQLLDEVAEADLQALAAAPQSLAWLAVPSLDVDGVKALSPARQKNLLRHWLATFTRLPDSAHWQGWRDLLEAADDAAPVWQLTDGQLRRSAGRLWWLTRNWSAALEAPADVALEGGRAVQLPGNGWVELSGSDFPTGYLSIRYRQGGEQLVIAGRGRRDLKRLLNESHWPAFVRSRVPLLFAGDVLVGIANYYPTQEQPWHLRWRPPVGEPLPGF